MLLLPKKVFVPLIEDAAQQIYEEMSEELRQDRDSYCDVRGIPPDVIEQVMKVVRGMSLKVREPLKFTGLIMPKNPQDMPNPQFWKVEGTRRSYLGHKKSPLCNTEIDYAVIFYKWFTIVHPSLMLGEFWLSDKTSDCPLLGIPEFPEAIERLAERAMRIYKRVRCAAPLCKKKLVASNAPKDLIELAVSCCEDSARLALEIELEGLSHNAAYLLTWARVATLGIAGGAMVKNCTFQPDWENELIGQAINMLKACRDRSPLALAADVREATQIWCSYSSAQAACLMMHTQAISRWRPTTPHQAPAELIKKLRSCLDRRIQLIASLMPMPEGQALQAELDRLLAAGGPFDLVQASHMLWALEALRQAQHAQDGHRWYLAGQRHINI